MRESLRNLVDVARLVVESAATLAAVAFAAVSILVMIIIVTIPCILLAGVVMYFGG